MSAPAFDHPAIPVTLADGITIPDALAVIRHMVLFEQRVYFGYDAASVPQDNTVTLADAQVANRIGARRSPSILGAWISAHATAVATALELIPPTTSMSDPEATIPWPALSSLFAAALTPATPGVSVSVATKILHKKRPGIIPILDEFVETYLVQTYAATEMTPLALTQLFKREYDAANVNGALTDIETVLGPAGVVLSPVRVLDKLLWARMLANDAPAGTWHL